MNCCVFLSHRCSAFMTAVCLEERLFRGEPLLSVRLSVRVVAICFSLFCNPLKCFLEPQDQTCFSCGIVSAPRPPPPLPPSLFCLVELSVCDLSAYIWLFWGTSEWCFCIFMRLFLLTFLLSVLDLCSY